MKIAKKRNRKKRLMKISKQNERKTTYKTQLNKNEPMKLYRK